MVEDQFVFLSRLRVCAPQSLVAARAMVGGPRDSRGIDVEKLEIPVLFEFGPRF